MNIASNQSVPTQILGDHPAVVYIIAPDVEGPCKIGFSKNIQQRLATLQIGCWVPLSIYSFRVGIFRSGGVDRMGLGRSISAGAKALERSAHRALHSCELNLLGEWFDVSVQEAVAVLEKCAKMEGLASLSLADIAGVHIPEGSSPSVENVRARMIKMFYPPFYYATEVQPYPVDRII